MRYLGHDAQSVIVAGRLEVATVCLDDGKINALALDFAIAYPAISEEIGASHLEPVEVVSIVGDPHLIGLAVANPYLASPGGHG